MRSKRNLFRETQVQRSAHEVLMQAVETQDALKSAILEKVRPVEPTIPRTAVVLTRRNVYTSPLRYENSAIALYTRH